MLLLTPFAFAAPDSDHKACVDGDIAACEAVVVAEGELVVRHLDTGTVPVWRLRALRTAVAQRVALAADALDPSWVSAVCHAAAPACPERAPRPAKEEPPFALVTTTSPGAVRWSRREESSVVVPLSEPVCAGPVKVEDSVFVVTRTPPRREEAAWSRCTRVHRFAVQTGERLEAPATFGPVQQLHEVDGHLLVNRRQIRTSEGRFLWTLGGPEAIASDGSSAMVKRSGLWKTFVPGLHEPVFSFRGTCGYVGAEPRCQQEGHWYRVDLDTGRLAEEVEGPERPLRERSSLDWIPPVVAEAERDLQGTVRDEDGLAVEGAQVLLVDKTSVGRGRSRNVFVDLLTSERVRAMVETGPDGRFGFEGLEAGVTWEIVALGRYGRASTDRIPVEAVDLDLDLMLDPSYELGRVFPEVVVEGPEGGPVEGMVWLTSRLQMPVPDGPFRIPEDGRVVGRSGVVSAEHDFGGTQFRVAVEEGEPKHCEVLLQSGTPDPASGPCFDLPRERAAELTRGTWTESDTGYTVQLKNDHVLLLDGQPIERLVLRDADGEAVSVRGLAAGAYTFRATMGDRSFPERVVEGQVTLEDGHHRVELVPTYDGPVPTERIQVRDAAGRPLPGSVIKAKTVWEEHMLVARTDFLGWADVPTNADGEVEATLWGIETLVPPPVELPAFSGWVDDVGTASVGHWEGTSAYGNRRRTLEVVAGEPVQVAGGMWMLGQGRVGFMPSPEELVLLEGDHLTRFARPTAPER